MRRAKHVLIAVVVILVGALMIAGELQKPPPVEAARPVVTTTTTIPVPPPPVAGWDDATVTITGCSDTKVAGVLTNTGTQTNTYIVAVEDDGGSFELGDGNVELTVPAGVTTAWTAPVTFSNPPTAPVSCLVQDVLTN